MSKLVATNFLGNLTRFPNGALDSGKAIDRTTWGHHPWTVPGAINFNDKQTDITGVITDTIIDGKPRVENGNLYVYAIGHTGKLYKIQVTDVATKNITFDTPVLLTTMTTATSFTQGGSMLFTNDIIYIGHDNGVSTINFDGTNEQSLGTTSDWQQNVPRLAKIYARNIYYTNGNTLKKIDPQGLISSYSTISESDEDQIFKTIDVDATGKFLLLVSSNILNTSLVTTSPNILATYPATSYIIKWDPVTEKIDSITSAPFEQTAARTVGPKEYIWGYDIPGGNLSEISDGLKKIVSGTGTFLVAQAPCTNATNSSGNLVGWATVEPRPTAGIYNVQGASFFIYGNLDVDESDVIYTRLISFASSLTGGDIIRVPWIQIVGDLQTAGNTSGYGSGFTQNATGTSRIYMSTVEFDGVNTAYKLYAFSVINPFLNPCAGVYETQAVIAGTEDTTVSEFTPSSVRVYLEPCLGYEAFTVDLIGIDGNAITNDSHTFSAFGTAASGTVTLSAEVSNGDLVTIKDADGTTIIYEFDNDQTVTAGHYPVTMGGTAALSAAALATAITTSYAGTVAMGSVTLNLEPSDGETITIQDANGTTKIFEFDNGGGVLPGHITVLLNGTPIGTATNLSVAIAANLNMIAGDNGNGSLTLRDVLVGSSGNHTITTTGVNIVVTGMTQGKDAVGVLNMTAVAASGVVTLTDVTAGVSGNHAIVETGATISATGMAGGVDPDIAPGDTKLTYTPTGSATAVLGIRFTNSGLFTPIIHKCEVDYT